jgi:hypothetical protein
LIIGLKRIGAPSIASTGSSKSSKNPTGSLFAIDDTNEEETSNEHDGAEQQIECVQLNNWLERSDCLNSFKCFYREKKDKQIIWTPWYALNRSLKSYCREYNIIEELFILLAIC